MGVPVSRELGDSVAKLERTSFVPLYFQLQEVIKQQIDSGFWAPGDRLPSEPELARRFAVSRIVVRQALAILEDDRQISRVKGKGTFVAQAKISHQAGGLSRYLATQRNDDMTIEVLDNRSVPVERSIYDELQIGKTSEVRRITTMLSLRQLPIAITYSFFRRSSIPGLEAAALVGRRLPNDLTLNAWGVHLAHAQALIETTQCGKFEADRFGVTRPAAAFLVLCTEFHQDNGRIEPFEVARISYRGDRLKLGIELPASSKASSMEISWELAPTERGP